MQYYLSFILSASYKNNQLYPPPPLPQTKHLMFWFSQTPVLENVNATILLFGQNVK